MAIDDYYTSSANRRLREDPNDVRGYKEEVGVFLEKEAPNCFVSKIERSFVELTVGCNLKCESKGQYFKEEANILLKAADIIKLHSATLGNFP